ncbi:MAG: DUF4956 domain-containing protein [Actinomycetota bacterium]|nr:DUF4956 domain-containing protein [Actinomycetota bacterium]
MLDSLFSSVMVSDAASLFAGGAFLFCTAASLVLGVVIAFIYMFRHDYSKNFVVTLALLPVIVQVVISLVNGNIGAGVAVMGVFNLVRFRSIPGSAKDIGAVFMAMAVGLATGMGYLGLAVVFTVIVGLANALFVITPLGGLGVRGVERVLKVTVPEDLNYSNAFDDVFAYYTSANRLLSVRTTNMGSLYQLEYRISIKDISEEKALLDAIRCLNGNLTVQCGVPVTSDQL